MLTLSKFWMYLTCSGISRGAGAGADAAGIVMGVDGWMGEMVASAQTWLNEMNDTGWCSTLRQQHRQLAEARLLLMCQSTDDGRRVTLPRKHVSAHIARIAGEAAQVRLYRSSHTLSACFALASSEIVTRERENVDLAGGEV